MGSMRSTSQWGVTGIPIDEREFQVMRNRLIQEDIGPEVSLSLACRNLNERIRELEYKRDPERRDIRAARSTLRSKPPAQVKGKICGVIQT